MSWQGFLASAWPLCMAFLPSFPLRFVLDKRWQGGLREAGSQLGRPKKGSWLLIVAASYSGDGCPKVDRGKIHTIRSHQVVSAGADPFPSMGTSLVSVSLAGDIGREHCDPPGVTGNPEKPQTKLCFCKPLPPLRIGLQSTSRVGPGAPCRGHILDG